MTLRSTLASLATSSVSPSFGTPSCTPALGLASHRSDWHGSCQRIPRPDASPPILTLTLTLTLAPDREPDPSPDLIPYPNPNALIGGAFQQRHPARQRDRAADVRRRRGRRDPDHPGVHAPRVQPEPGRTRDGGPGALAALAPTLTLTLALTPTQPNPDPTPAAVRPLIRSRSRDRKECRRCKTFLCARSRQ